MSSIVKRAVTFASVTGCPFFVMCTLNAFGTAARFGLIWNASR